MDAQHIEFERYLVREFLWELEQFEPHPSGFSDLQPGSIKVLSVRSYDDLRVRLGGAVLDVRLSWSGQLPPQFQRVENITG